jgi:hypothetical protein
VQVNAGSRVGRHAFDGLYGEAVEHPVEQHRSRRNHDESPPCVADDFVDGQCCASDQREQGNIEKERLVGLGVSSQSQFGIIDKRFDPWPHVPEVGVPS